MIQLRGISKRYRDHQAVQETDLCIASGQTTVLIGPSGCGKSTLLRMIVGLIAPDTGEVLFDGVPLSRTNLREVRRRMGYVIQDGGLFPHLTAKQNVELLARHVGWDARQRQERLRELAELTHLRPALWDRYPGQLSGGERQRVSLMRALMLDPAVLLLDEPLGALDPMIRYELQAELKEIFARLRKTVVLVTHDMGEAAFLGDHLLLLRAGRIVQQGTAVELIQQPSDPFVTTFIQAQRSVLDELPRDGETSSGPSSPHEGSRG